MRALEIAETLRVLLNQHAAIAARGDQVIGITGEATVPGTELNTPAVFAGQQIQSRRDDAVLSVLRRNVGRMSSQPNALFSQLRHGKYSLRLGPPFHLDCSCEGMQRTTGIGMDDQSASGIVVLVEAPFEIGGSADVRLALWVQQNVDEKRQKRMA